MNVTPERLYTAIDATWPPAVITRSGPWHIREGRGGGKRVSAATAAGQWGPDDLIIAEEAMTGLGQTPLFMIRAGEDDLDAALSERGYDVIDPVTLYAAPCADLAGPPLPHATAFPIWPPLAIMAEIWQGGGIGPDRLAVMRRVQGPKTGLLARLADQPGGVGFAACDADVAMVHAIEVPSAVRRQGAGRNIMRAAAHWAQDHGATTLALAVTNANNPANSLYSSLNMGVVGHYHYRIKQGV